MDNICFRQLLQYLFNVLAIPMAEHFKFDSNNVRGFCNLLFCKFSVLYTHKIKRLFLRELRLVQLRKMLHHYM